MKQSPKSVDRRHVLLGLSIAGASTTVGGPYALAEDGAEAFTQATDAAPSFPNLEAAEEVARSSANLTNGFTRGVLVNVQGYRSPGDGGGFLGMVEAQQKAENPDGGHVAPVPIASGALAAAAWGVLPTINDIGPALQRVLDAAVLQRRPVLLPAGHLRIGTSVKKMFQGDLHLNSEGGTLLSLSSTNRRLSMLLGGQHTNTIKLASDAMRGGSTVNVSEVGNLAIGDILHFNTDTVPQRAYGYRKQCVRRVASIEGGQVRLDQPLEWDFTTAENTRIKHWRPGRVFMSNIRVMAEPRHAMRLDSLACSRVQQCDYEDPTPGWENSEWTDGHWLPWGFKRQYQSNSSHRKQKHQASDQPPRPQYELTSKFWSAMGLEINTFPLHNVGNGRHFGRD